MASKLKQQIEQDLKAALLSGNKKLALTLRGVKSAILYEEVAKGKREEGMTDNEIIEVLGREAKKRQESADLYKKGNEIERAEAELAEKTQIEKYMPMPLTDEEIMQLIIKAETVIGELTTQNMGQFIGWVKSMSAGAADGTRIAQIVKSRLDKK